MRPDIVAQARQWIGTPYRHQCRRLGAGADCLGLVVGVWQACVGELPASLPPYSPDWSEPQGDERLWQAAQAYFRAKPLSQASEGDLILFRMRDGSVAKHLGIQSEVGATPAFIHAYSGHGVVESRLTPPWARRVVARFDFPERSL